MPLRFPDTWGVKKRWTTIEEESSKPKKGYWSKYPIGARVELKRDVDRFPSFGLVSKGKKGTVVENTKNEIYIKMDDYIEDAEEWDNCIEWYIDDFDEDMVGNPIDPLKEISDDVRIIRR